MRRDDHLLRCRVPKSPGLGAIRVANEDAFARVGLQRLALLLANKHIGQAPENSKVGDIRLAPIALPDSVGNVAIEGRGGHAIVGVHKRRNGVAPE